MKHLERLACLDREHRHCRLCSIMPIGMQSLADPWSLVVEASRMVPVVGKAPFQMRKFSREALMLGTKLVNATQTAVQ